MAIFATISTIPAMHRLRLLSRYLRGSAVCPGLPPTVVIANTHTCNHFCRMCIREAVTFDGPNMEVRLFRQIIDEGASYFRYISLDGPGETIMNPEAFDLIRYAKAKGIRMVFSTNATLMTPDLVESILDSGLDHIIFSLNGTSRDVYAAIHGVDAYDFAVANIRQFLARKCDLGASIMVTLQMVCLRQTLHQVDEFYRTWRGLPGVNSVRVKKDVVAVERLQSGESASRAPRRNACARLWYGPVFIETNGDVYASPGVLYKAPPVGNVWRSSLAQIWNNEQMQAMRRAHASGDESPFPECVDCSYSRPRLPLIVGGFLLDPFLAGRLMPIAERFAYWHSLPLYERFSWKAEFSRILKRTGATKTVSLSRKP
ncbi:MAG: radical SAM protein [Acidobacteria bacterium]|nr:radical SAM protein [Acidobacteriota bacterium]